jgi:hypothetical protein
MTMLSVALLVHFDGANGSTGITDVHGHVFTYVPPVSGGGAPSISTTQSKFGGASANLVFTGSGIAGYWSTPATHDFDFGTGDFTVEFWIWPTINNSGGVICGEAATVTGPFVAFFSYNNKVRVYQNGAIVLQSTGTAAVGQFTAVAIVRLSGTLTIYLNGVASGSVADANNYVGGTNTFNIFGGASFSGNEFDGYLDELRITPGTALYSTNYTPATSAFSNGGGPTLNNYFLSPIGNGQTFFYTGTMNPLNAGLINTYVAGTTAPITTYQTSSGTAQSNPIVLTAGGQINGELWFYAGSVVKLVVTDALGNLIQTYDNVYGINDLSGFSNNATSGVEWISTGLTPTYASSTSFTTPGNTTSTFQTGRRVQATVSAGTVYGTVTSSSYGTTTTVNLDMDASQVLDSGLSAVNVGLLGSTGQNTSVPMSWVNDLTLRNLTATGTIAATGAITATGGVTGNVTGALTGNASTATNLNTANAAVSLGADWSVDSNGQISNNANTGYIGSYTNTSVISSGTTISMTNSEFARGSNFSLSSGNVQTAAAGLYEVVYTFQLVNNNSGTYSYNLYFTPSAGTVYGPTSGAPYVAQLNSASIYNSVTLVCLWGATAGSNINVTSSVTFTGNNSVANGAQMTIRRVA